MLNHKRKKYFAQHNTGKVSNRDMNMEEINTVEIVDSCLGRNVYVKLENGQRRKVEYLCRDDIIEGDGELLKVENVVVGGEHVIYRIQTKDEREILLTKLHLIRSQGEPVRIKNLKPGDILDSVDGEATEVASIEEISYEDKVYSLTFHNRKQGTYFNANGFLVSDFKMQYTLLLEQEIFEQKAIDKMLDTVGRYIEMFSMR